MQAHIKKLLSKNDEKLTQEEEIEVFDEFKKHKTKELRDAIIVKYLWLVDLIVGKTHGADGDFDDWVQDGRIGLIHAVDEYDPSMKSSFYSYAFKWIQFSIYRGSSKTAGSFRLPAYIKDRARHITEAGQQYIKENGCKPDITYIMKATGLSEKEIDHAWIAKMMSEEVSYDSLVAGQYDEDATATIGDFQMDKTWETAFEEVEMNAGTDELIILLKSCLKDREYFVLKNRLGLEGCEVKTLEQISDMLCLSRERIRQIENSALKKIADTGGVKHE